MIAGVAYDHVVFDLDGTLVDSRADLAAAVNDMLSGLGLAEIDLATVARYVGDGARVLVERALGPAHGDLFGPGLERFLAYYANHLLDRTQPYPSIPDALGTIAAAGPVLSVLTNKPVAMSRAILAGLDLAARFRDVVGGDSLPVRKPDPAGIEDLRAGTGTPRERVLLVGDSPIDLRTARAARVAFCAAGWGFAPDVLRAAEPDVMIAHPLELVDVVARGVDAPQRRTGTSSS